MFFLWCFLMPFCGLGWPENVAWFFFANMGYVRGCFEGLGCKRAEMGGGWPQKAREDRKTGLYIE